MNQGRITVKFGKRRDSLLGRSYLRLVIFSILFASLIVGCGTVPHRTPLPKEFHLTAEIPEIPRSRIWGDAAPPYVGEWYTMSEAEMKEKYSSVVGKEHHYLAISGGGANGAFGVGLLVGWTEAGTRPEFTLVTGVSTGGLIAPFAFLGSEYDQQLREIYTSVSTKDLLIERRVLTGLTSDAMTDSTPLQNLIKKYVTPEMMARVAAEGQKGRELFIGTTNLDAGRPVLWDITAIAKSGAPHALELIHQVMLASASIPVAFPPVLIEVEANGQRYDELHVDGGATSQVFLYPMGIDWAKLKDRFKVRGTPEVYVIRNAFIEPEYEPLEPKLKNITVRTIDSLLRTQGYGDLYRIVVAAQRDGLTLNLAYIPAEFQEKPNEPFDNDYMKKLFNFSYERAKKGYSWQTRTPQ